MGDRHYDLYWGIWNQKITELNEAHAKKLSDEIDKRSNLESEYNRRIEEATNKQPNTVGSRAVKKVFIEGEDSGKIKVPDDPFAETLIFNKEAAQYINDTLNEGVRFVEDVQGHH